MFHGAAIQASERAVLIALSGRQLDLVQLAQELGVGPTVDGMETLRAFLDGYMGPSGKGHVEQVGETYIPTDAGAMALRLEDE